MRRFQQEVFHVGRELPVREGQWGVKAERVGVPDVRGGDEDSFGGVGDGGTEDDVSFGIPGGVDPVAGYESRRSAKKASAERASTNLPSFTQAMFSR